MITNKLYSPFIFYGMVLVLIAGACNENKPLSVKQKAALDVNSKILAAEDVKKSLDVRLNSATDAYDIAVKLDSTYLIWKAFSVKYPLLRTENPEKSALFLKSYRNFSAAKKDTLNLANAFFEVGKLFAEDQKPDSAYFYYNASRMLCEARNDSLAVVEKLTNIAYMHFTYNDFAEFENTTTTALRFLPRIPKSNLDSIYLSYAYNNYGLAYTNLSEPELALQYYRKALTLNKNSSFANTIANNMGLLFMSNDQYAQAIKQLSGLADSKEVQKDTTLYSQVMDNLGYSLFKLDNPAGYEFLVRAQELRKKNN